MEQLNVAGAFNFILGLVMGFIQWICNIDLGSTIQVLTVLSLFIGIIFVLMRMYDQYLVTRKRKRDNERKPPHM